MRTLICKNKLLNTCDSQFSYSVVDIYHFVIANLKNALFSLARAVFLVVLVVLHGCCN